MHNLKTQNKRLKKDLKNAYRDNRDLHAGRPQRNPKGTEFIREAMKDAHKANNKKKFLEKKNSYYKSVAEAYQNHNLARVLLEYLFERN